MNMTEPTQQPPNETRVSLSAEQLDAMMPEGEYVHTLTGGNGLLMGCDMKRDDILKSAAERGAELSGETATAMNHGAAVRTDRGWIFVATNPTP